ncbi:MAG: RcnB family protein [Sphingobium sp.]
MVKKIVTAILAASIVSGPVLAAPHHDDHRPGAKKMVVHQPQYRSWHKGERFDRHHARNYRVIEARRYRLKEPPRGYRWVRSGNDAVLIGITSGIVSAVIANAIR